MTSCYVMCSTKIVMTQQTTMDVLSNIRDNASPHYDNEFFNEHFKVHINFPLCDKKQNILTEYYKKRERWTDTCPDDLESEYKACIYMLNYIQSIMFGGNNQYVYDNMCKALIQSNSISIDDDYELKEDILDCVTYYKDGFQGDDDNDDDFEYSLTERDLQVKIIDIMVKILNNPNFQEVYPDERV